MHNLNGKSKTNFEFSTLWHSIENAHTKMSGMHRLRVRNAPKPLKVILLNLSSVANFFKKHFSVCELASKIPVGPAELWVVTGAKSYNEFHRDYVNIIDLKRSNHSKTAENKMF